MVNTGHREMLHEGMGHPTEQLRRASLSHRWTSHQQRGESYHNNALLQAGAPPHLPRAHTTPPTAILPTNRADEVGRLPAPPQHVHAAPPSARSGLTAARSGEGCTRSTEEHRKQAADGRLAVPLSCAPHRNALGLQCHAATRTRCRVRLVALPMPAAIIALSRRGRAFSSSSDHSLEACPNLGAIAEPPHAAKRRRRTRSGRSYLGPRRIRTLPAGVGRGCIARLRRNAPK